MQSAKRHTMIMAILLTAALVPAAVEADTTFVNTTLIPSGTLTGIASLAGQSNHSGIFIYVGGTSIVGATNSSGAYTIVGVPYGTYTLTAAKASAAPQIHNALEITHHQSIMPASETV